MNISEKGKNFIKKFESLSLKPYLCPAGVWTIGYGHTNGVNKNTKPIQEWEADNFLVEDLMSIVRKLPENELEGLSQNKIDAVISFAFNLGAGAYNASTLRKVIKSDPDNHDAVRREFMKWVNAGGKRLEGLVRRRSEEADMYCEG